MQGTETAAADHGGNPDTPITVTVHNEDNGDVYELHGGQGEPLENLVKQLYDVHLKTTRKPGDRLRCESSGQDVFAYADEGMTVGTYFATHCTDRTWLFAAETGGA
jgi:hypothetical protein